LNVYVLAYGGRRTTYLEAYQQQTNNEFVCKRCMDVEQNKVIQCQPHKQHPAKDVTPYVDCLICPPEYARQAKE
jgi:hypothetical protein